MHSYSIATMVCLCAFCKKKKKLSKRTKTLLSFIPLSCMVVPIRELVNIQTSTSASNTKPTQIAFIPANVVMDIDNDFIRERFNFSSKCYGMLWTLTFFIFLYLFFLILFLFLFFLLVTIKRHMTSQSHDMLHDVTS